MAEANAVQGADLASLNVSDPVLYRTDEIHQYFDRLRAEAPVHYYEDATYGPFWSITRYSDIVGVEARPDLFSSSHARGGHIINYPRLFDPNDDFGLPMFIAMDDPQHSAQRKTVAPMVAPRNLAALEDEIRSRAAAILDALPLNETFDWVERVSIELTTQVLAMLFRFPFEEREKLTYWSDMTMVESDDPEVMARRKSDLLECAARFSELWRQRSSAAPADDLISMMAHGEATKDMSELEFLGNTLLLIVGGNDTTRNSISGGVLALNQFAQEYDKLRADRSLVNSMVPEIIRWQTPLAHMARIATQDTRIRGCRIRAGERVVMWYISGNRDESKIEHAHDFRIDRANPRQHLSFGFGVHRCLGNRLAEMQLRIVWEEILQRFECVELAGTPVRTESNIIHGFTSMPVRLHAWS